MMPYLVRRLAVKHTLVQPENITHLQTHVNRSGSSHVKKIGLRGALQHQEFAHEIIQERQADTGQHGDHESSRKPRGDGSHATIVGDDQRVTALVEIAHQNEQGAGRDTMIEHLIYRAIHADLSERKYV